MKQLAYLVAQLVLDLQSIGTRIPLAAMVGLITAAIVPVRLHAQSAATDRAAAWLLPFAAATATELLPPDPEPTGKPWIDMNYGPTLTMSLEVAPGNIACKGISARLDKGPGDLGGPRVHDLRHRYAPRCGRLAGPRIHRLAEHQFQWRARGASQHGRPERVHQPRGSRVGPTWHRQLRRLADHRQRSATITDLSTETGPTSRDCTITATMSCSRIRSETPTYWKCPARKATRWSSRHARSNWARGSRI